MNRLEVHITEDSGNTIVTLTGMADLEAAQSLQGQLIPIVKRKATGMVVMDLSRVTYIASVALGILFWFNGQLKARGRSLRLAGMTPSVASTFEVACVHRAMPLYPSVGEALMGTAPEPKAQ